MPIEFIDNYNPNYIESSITKKDGTPLWGEIWIYNQFLQINENNFLPDDIWYLKHNFNLSIHPACKGKVEGQIDFFLLSKSGLLIIEVKGGGIRVDENDTYFSYDKDSEYLSQNPFVQAKEYVHSLIELIGKSNLFIYKAIVFPHEAGFELKGPQLVGYKDNFYSKKDYKDLNSDKAINQSFFKFISELSYKSKRHNIKQLNPNWDNERINSKIHQSYPNLTSKEIRRLKCELFPNQLSYGYNPDRIISEIILKENYEILKGLRRNQKVLVQGVAGTGKTVLAQKFIAENLLRQHKGIVFCANLLVKAKFEHILINEYQLDLNYIKFSIFSEKLTFESISQEIDFLVFDEAQEYFDKGLFDFIYEINKKLDNPKILVLYDPEQTIISDLMEIGWYADFFIESGFTHFHFDEIYRCIQNKYISNISNLILKSNQFSKITSEYEKCFFSVKDTISKLKFLKSFNDETNFLPNEKILLIHSRIIENFKLFCKDYFKNEIEELTELNINVPSQKIRFTTPIKYRGLENKSVVVIVDELNISNKTQLYIGVTRAMEELKVVLWKD